MVSVFSESFFTMDLDAASSAFSHNRWYVTLGQPIDV
jgi:hypothetical protein